MSNKTFIEKVEVNGEKYENGWKDKPWRSKMEK